MTHRLLSVSSLSNILKILAILFGTVCPFFEKTSAIAIATLITAALPAFVGICWPALAVVASIGLHLLSLAIVGCCGPSLACVGTPVGRYLVFIVELKKKRIKKTYLGLETFRVSSPPPLLLLCQPLLAFVGCHWPAFVGCHEPALAVIGLLRGSGLVVVAW